MPNMIGVNYNMDVLKALYNQKQADDAEEIKKKVKNKLSEKMSEQAVQVYEQSGNMSQVLSKLNQMLPSGNQASDYKGNVIIGQTEKDGPEALPAISPDEEANLISQAFAGYQQNKQQNSNETQNIQNTQNKPEEKQMGLLKRLFIGGLEGFAAAAAPDLYTQKLQKQELEQGGKLGEQSRKAEIDFALEEYAQNRLDKRELLKQKIESGQGISLDEASQNLSDILSVWGSVRTGPISGTLNQLGATLGWGSEKLSTLSSMSEIMSYTLGGYFTGQTGRALDKRDKEVIDKAIKITPRTKERDLIGKVQSAVNFVNAKIKAENNMRRKTEQQEALLLPDARTMVTRSKKKLNPLTGQPIQQNQTNIEADPNIQSELDAINQRLQELGG